MLITNGRIIYAPYEHLTNFVPNARNIHGYKLLETKNEGFLYGINTEPVYIKRNYNIENGLSTTDVLDEYYLEERLLTEGMKKGILQEIRYRKLLELYECAKIFNADNHIIKMKCDGTQEVLNKLPAHYTILREDTMYRVNNWQEKTENYAVLSNSSPVMCKKNIGELDYPDFGIKLKKNDEFLLNLRRTH